MKTIKFEKPTYEELEKRVRELEKVVLDRKRTDEAVKKNEQLLKLYIEFTPAATAMCDLHMRYLAYSRRWIADYNLPEENLLGRSHYDLFKTIPEHWKQQHQRCFKGEVIVNSEEPFTRSDGTVDWVRRNLHPWVTEDNNVGGLIMFTEVITERKQAEKDKERLQFQLQQSQKMESIGNLAGGIAHDFNNILSSIIGFTELALDETPKGTLAEDSLQEVYSAGKRAKDLVQQILTFARQSDEKRTPLLPSKIAREVLKFIRPTIPTTIEIQQNLDSESWITGNATRVYQVLMNLCTNAAHAMEDSGGVLTVSMKDLSFDKENSPIGMKAGDYVEIKVSDTGSGIAPEIIDSIFEPYFTTKEPGEGTGMGLAIVRGVIESYDGKISVASQLPKGTTFTTYLPITKKRDHKAYVPEQLPTGTEHILFVDDEHPIAKMGRRTFESLGYSVTTRTSSEEALELFKAKPNDFDLVVTDMTMPNMTGDQLAIELMKIRNDIPVILCTGFSKRISDDSIADIGIRAFAYKPIVKADLAKTVRKVLDNANTETQE